MRKPLPDTLVPASLADPVLGEHLSRVTQALEFMKSVTAECHGGSVQMDGIGLSAIFGLISEEATRALCRYEDLRHTR